MTANFQSVGFVSQVVGIVDGPAGQPEQALLDRLEVPDVFLPHRVFFSLKGLAVAIRVTVSVQCGSATEMRVKHP